MREQTGEKRQGKEERKIEQALTVYERKHLPLSRCGIITAQREGGKFQLGKIINETGWDKVARYSRRLPRRGSPGSKMNAERTLTLRSIDT